MLAAHPIDVMLTATNLGAVKQFYNEKVGLEILIEADEFVTFKCGGDSRLIVTRSSVQRNEDRTMAIWRVEDVAAEVGQLRGRGVEITEYDEPGYKTVDGIVDVGFALTATFIDPGGNAIEILEFKDKDKELG